LKSIAEAADNSREPARDQISGWISPILIAFQDLVVPKGWAPEWEGGPSGTNLFWSPAMWTYHSFLLVDAANADMSGAADTLGEDGVDVKLPAVSGSRQIRLT
jgi:hypothetical protein